MEQPKNTLRLVIIIAVLVVVVIGVVALQSKPGGTDLSVRPSEPVVQPTPVKPTPAPAPTPTQTTPETPKGPANQTPSAPHNPGEDIEVIFTDAGFAPQTLTVKMGKVVTFKNLGSVQVWPASAFHPTHEIYPTTGGCLGSTFDACRGINSGESWSFKFDVAGNWKYHDHLNPSRSGTIVVEK
ncbi:hypothetical protein HY967_04340 [Candidatus Jorgensenbacteria bacterium]|nr:hypothetical protein [Candidatus Jorgensenbacteria bacterium]